MTATGAVVVDAHPPGSPEWMRYMTASKVAAVVGLSPWESRFSLWHKMSGTIDSQSATVQTRRGHYLEGAVRTWLADQHPDLVVVENTAMYVHPDVPWAAATPDGFSTAPAAVECKTSASMDEWGPAGTDEIPPYYAAQVQWQMACTATDLVHVAVLLPRLEFREYTIERDDDDIDLLLNAADRFMDTLPGRPGYRPPGVDEHTATYQALRAMHPDIDRDATAVVPDDLHDEWCRTRIDADVATAAHSLARAEVLDVLGQARYGTLASDPDRTVFRRQANGRNGISLIHVNQKETT